MTEPRGWIYTTSRDMTPEREDFAKHLVRPLVPEEAIPTFERMAGRA